MHGGGGAGGQPAFGGGGGPKDPWEVSAPRHFGCWFLVGRLVALLEILVFGS